MDEDKIFKYNPTDQLKTLTEIYSKFIESAKKMHTDTIEGLVRVQSEQRVSKEPSLETSIKELNEKIVELTNALKSSNIGSSSNK